MGKMPQDNDHCACGKVLLRNRKLKKICSDCEVLQ